MSRDGEYDDDALECPECGEELDPDTGLCPNEECAYHDEEPGFGSLSDAQERQEERRRMGIDS